MNALLIFSLYSYLGLLDTVLRYYSGLSNRFFPLFSTEVSISASVILDVGYEATRVIYQIYLRTDAVSDSQQWLQSSAVEKNCQADGRQCRHPDGKDVRLPWAGLRLGLWFPPVICRS